MRISRLIGLGATAVLAVGLAACSSTPASTGDDTAGGASDDAFPVTIEHAFGSTTIEEKPENVASIAWANHEVPLALGIVPVGMSKATWGDDDDNGVLPWVEEKLDELGADMPVLFDETDGIDFEAVADTAPDVILASYSGLTQEEYDTLSQIAPVVAYPEIAWATPVEDMITMNSQALGLAEEGEALIEELHGEIDAALEANSALQDKTVLFAFLDVNDLSQVAFYTSHDTRPGFLESVGLPAPSIVEEMSADSTEFYLSVSAEEADRFDDVDVFVTYGDESIIPILQADPLLSKIPAIEAGQIVVLPDSSPIAASANPSPLSISWGIDEYFALLAAPFADD
ncbi:MAG: iron-siderophore ABC transporter substrate-binding protein [Actinomycetota bacterium]